MPNRTYDDEMESHDGFQPRDREITLGATTILGIFFALVIVCAIFFGLGYQVGRKSAVGAIGAKDQALLTSGATVDKPSAGSPLLGSSGRSTDGGSSGSVPLAPVAAPEPQPTPVTSRVADTDGDRSSDGAATTVVPVAPPPPSVGNGRPAVASLVSAAAPSGAGWVVQVAAVSHQEDADLLSGELRRRGYNVAVHSEPSDRLLHVQIGALATHKDADAMRQRLLNDGFNAIVKEIH